MPNGISTPILFQLYTHVFCGLSRISLSSIVPGCVATPGTGSGVTDLLNASNSNTTSDTPTHYGNNSDLHPGIHRPIEQQPKFRKFTKELGRLVPVNVYCPNTCQRVLNLLTVTVLNTSSVPGYQCTRVPAPTSLFVKIP
eukprot:289141-Rhodomonas_salina.1